MTPSLARHFFEQFSSSLNTSTKVQVQADHVSSWSGAQGTGAPATKNWSQEQRFSQQFRVCVCHVPLFQAPSP
jgi:hypothetical protein